MTTIGQTWITLVQSFAIIALILTALRLMLDMVKPVDALRYVVAILGMAVVMMLISGALVNLWEAISFWQWVGLAATGIYIWRWRRRGGGKPSR